MSKSELDRFAAAVKSDAGLQVELKKVAVSDQAIVGFAQSKGYDIDAAEVSAYVAERKAQLSLTDLDKVAGGGKTHTATNVEVVSEAAVTTVEAQNSVTSTTAAAEAEIVIVAT